MEGKKLKEPRTAVSELAGSSEGIAGVLLPADPARAQEALSRGKSPFAAREPCEGGLGSVEAQTWLPGQPGHTHGQQSLAPLLMTALLLPKETSVKI